jgi:ubiquitin-conjugating enzyme E2 D/E
MYVKSTIWLKKYILREIDGIEYLGLTYELDDPNDVYNFAVFLPGPKNSPYEGGTWRIEVTYTADYPFKPPKIIFDTPIYHPNIRSDGTFYLPMIVDNWSIENSLVKVRPCARLTRHP